MVLRNLARFLVLAFVSVTLFGLPLSLPVLTHHSHHCPPMGTEMARCATVLDHIDHWQEAFAGVVTAFLLLAAVAYVLQVLRLRPVTFITQVRRHCNRSFHDPGRPTLFQELFSQGLLNPKIP